MKVEAEVGFAEKIVQKAAVLFHEGRGWATRRTGWCLGRNGRQSSVMVLLLVLLVSAVAGAPGALAEVYRWQDEQGRAHYSDRAAPGAEPVPIRTPPAASAGDGRSVSGDFLRVVKVYDGDTVELENGDKVRLLGINTPEIGGHKAEEPGGVEAARWLRSRLEGQTVRLEGDAEATDRYRRRLAYLFAADGEFINLTLLERGLATTDVFPPNLKYTERMVEAERRAEQARRGLWALAAYQPKTVAQLGDDELSGWQRVRGRVREVEDDRRGVQLRFDGPFRAGISRSNLRHFPNPQSYVGREVEVRGWVNRRGRTLYMNLRHPAAIREP